MARPKPGPGERFARLSEKLAKRQGIVNPKPRKFGKLSLKGK